jgi:hypothetical protein
VVFSDIIGTKILRILLQSSPPADFTPYYGFHGLLHESGWGLGAVNIISLLPLIVITLFFHLLIHFIYL